MSDKLQQAIAATRAGQKRDAQLLLAEELEENPNNEHAWFLLSNLVDSPEKRMAYLGKALTLNPQYEKAKQQLAQVQRQVIAAPTTKKAEPVIQEPITKVMAFEEEIEEEAPLPEWLDDQVEEVEEAVAVKAVTVVEEKKVTKKTAVTPPAKPTPQPDHQKQLQQYNIMLGALIFFIIVILILLIV